MKKSLIAPIVALATVLALPAMTTAAPPTTVPATTVPETTVPETTVPETTVPETTVPETTVPGEVGVVSIASVTVTIENARAQASIEVVDQDGNPVEGARVKGYWSQGARGRSRARSNADGIATTRRVLLFAGRGHGHRWGRPDPGDEPLQPTFTVTNVRVPEGYQWDGERASGVADLLTVTASVSVSNANNKATATITVVDNNDNPVPLAIVIGEWSGDAQGKRWTLTRRNGVGTTRRVRSSGDNPVFTITQLRLPPGYEWDGTQNSA